MYLLGKAKSYLGGWIVPNESTQIETMQATNIYLVDDAGTFHEKMIIIDNRSLNNK